MNVNVQNATPADLLSRVVRAKDLPWQKMRFPGCEMKTLLFDPTSGLATALMRMAPGAVLPDHEHVLIEQTYVLEGSLVDDEGECTAGNFVIRAKGSRHAPRAPKGCTMLVFFLKPTEVLKKALRIHTESLEKAV